MFARVLERQAKDSKGAQISTKMTNDVLPCLQKQPDFFALSDTTNAERLVCVSFWTSREGDAEEYHRQHYEMITNMLKPVLESAPTLETFTVSASTAHRIARAA
jgi:hypothetical protein